MTFGVESAVVVVVGKEGDGTVGVVAGAVGFEAAVLVVVVEGGGSGGGAVEVVATRSQEGHMVSVVAGSCM